jgi:hypothetical protein
VAGEDDISAHGARNGLGLVGQTEPVKKGSPTPARGLATGRDPGELLL